MSKAKKDLRINHDDFYDLSEKALYRHMVRVCHSMSSGSLVDNRYLLEKIDDKKANIIANQDFGAEVSSDGGEVVVKVALNSLCANRRGAVATYDITIESAKGNRVDRYETIDVVSFTTRYNSKYYRPTVAEIIEEVNEYKHNTLEETFNKTLYKNGLAPTSDTLYSD